MIHFVVMGAGFIIAGMLFLLLLAVQGQIKQAGIRTYVYIDRRLKEQKRGLLDYGRIEQFLRKNGAVYRMGAAAEPIKYIGVCAILSAAGAMAGFQIYPLLSLPFAALGASVPKGLIWLQNKKDNEKMLQELKMVYQFLGMQSGAGVYLTDALKECFRAAKHKRLKAGLLRLANEIAMNGEVDKALQHFSQSFDNTYIDTLCIVISQAMESGQTVDLLKDISDQVKEVEQNLLYKRQESLERKIGFFQLLFLTGIAGTVLLCCGQGLLKLISNFY